MASGIKNNTAKDEKKKRRPSAGAVMAFLLTSVFCIVIAVSTVINKIHVEKLVMEQVIIEKSANANEVISRLLYKTHTISAILQLNDGIIEDFDLIAANIIDDPAILNILMAPGGVVNNVYPLEGNEAVLGLDFFSEGAGNKEAVMAVELDRLVFGGPFNLIQGGQALVGRLPVYIDEPDGGKAFWGLVSVTLKYPEALDGAGFKELPLLGFDYEVWRINPDNNEKQIITGNANNYGENSDYIEKHVKIIDSDWYFRIFSTQAWYNYFETWFFAFTGIFISILVAFVVQDNHDLKIFKTKMENMAYSDSLTGIYNRRHFMQYGAAQMNRDIRTNSVSYIMMFDLDNFKRINDNYGHVAGDTVLKDIALNVKGLIRDYDIFARFGGEEFILYFDDIDIESMRSLAERIRLAIAEKSVESDGENIFVTASFGVSQAAPFYDFETAIKLSDTALYKAKEYGRNRVVFYDDIEPESTDSGIA